MSEPMTLEQASHNLRMYANTDCDVDGVPIVLACADAIDAAIAERNALRARIESAPTAIAHKEYYGGCHIYGPEDLDGKRVRLIVEDEA